jgi:Tetratricopeptide repeat
MLTAPCALKAANNLAESQRSLGKLELAHQLHRDTLTRYLGVLGVDHPDTLNPANNLAVAMTELRDYPSARELLEDTLRRYREVLGDDHPRHRELSQQPHRRAVCAR